jgi:hypothetical protein
MGTPLAAGVAMAIACSAGYVWTRRFERRWTLLTGELLAVTLGRDSDGGGRLVKARYRYQLGGREVEAESLASRSATWRQDQPQPGARVELLVDPSAPERCVERAAVVFVRRLLAGLIALGLGMAVTSFFL